MLRIFLELNVTLCYHSKHWKYSKPKTTRTYTQLDFPLLLRYLSIVKDEANYFD